MLKCLNKLMKIYLITSDARVNQTMETHSHFFKKYWPSADVTVLGYEPPQCDSDFIKFESLGIDMGVDFLTKQLYDYFSKIDESQFIFCVDDMPITRPIDIEFIKYTEELLKGNGVIGRIGLTSDNVRRPHILETNITDRVNLIENNYDAMFKLSATWSAWNRDYFLLYLNDYKNLWDWELRGSKKSVQDDFRILSYVPPPMRFSHLIKHGDINPEWYKEAYYGVEEMFYDDQQKIREIYNGEIK